MFTPSFTPIGKGELFRPTGTNTYIKEGHQPLRANFTWRALSREFKTALGPLLLGYGQFFSKGARLCAFAGGDGHLFFFVGTKPRLKSAL
jgi:hypothetical protein